MSGAVLHYACGRIMRRAVYSMCITVCLWNYANLCSTKATQPGKHQVIKSNRSRNGCILKIGISPWRTSISHVHTD